MTVLSGHLRLLCFWCLRRCKIRHCSLASAQRKESRCHTSEILGEYIVLDLFSVNSASWYMFRFSFL